MRAVGTRVVMARGEEEGEGMGYGGVTDSGAGGSRDEIHCSANFQVNASGSGVVMHWDVVIGSER